MICGGRVPFFCFAQKRPAQRTARVI